MALHFKRQGGYAIITDPAYGQQEEQDSFSCFHCGKVVWTQPFQDNAAIGGLCKSCDKYICPGCVAKRTCRPLEKWIESVERNVEMLERRRQNDEAMG